MKHVCIIRPYHSLDYPGCISGFDSNCPAFFAHHEKEEFQVFLHDESGEHSMYYYVVEFKGQIVACAGFHLPETEGKTAGLVWGMVTREFQRQGIGEMLLDFRLNKIRELCPGVSVVLDTTQLSFPFFEKAGFRTTKITKDYYAPGLDRYDMILKPSIFYCLPV